ncbi:MAG: cytochrome c biogenesis protein CcsA [Armatimonadota bacterium]|nr:cytochrome c biogenesis protein CcsA [Armatimonadota bacterium]
MQIGTILLWLCMATTLAAIAAYVTSAFKRSSLAVARGCYCAMMACAVATSVYLMALILNNCYDINYVSAYSSPDLPLVYKVSAFWAGQEGSFLLWALFGGIIGIVLASRARDLEPWLMAFWSAVQAFFFTLLLIKSPFAAASQDLLSRFPNGQGLNPLLQNFWMAVHPPLVFLGYAAMAAPAAFVVAALIKRDYKTWCDRCLPWALFSWVTLGAGIIIGSYWAYEVLGWGGYWSWDPVENASLVPWLACTALLHGMLVERYRGSMRRINMVLALLSFLLVIYATFLTRSGILGDFSVHSFEGIGKGSSAYLIGFMLFFTVLCLGLLVWRQREVESRSWYGGLIAKESAFFVGIISLSALALLVIIGTSSPLITKALGRKPDSVGIGYYGLVSSPITLVLLLLLSLAPLLRWASRGRIEEGSSLALKLVAAILGLALISSAVIAAAAGTDIALSFAIGSLAVVALLVNAWFAHRHGWGNWRMLGAYTVHAGAALMLIGMVFSPSSTRPSDTVRIVLPRGDKVQKLGYRFTFLGVESAPNAKNVIRVKVERDGKSFIARPAMTVTKNEVIQTPHIRKTLSKDLYIAPQEVKSLKIEPILHSTPRGRTYTDAFTPDGGFGVRLAGVSVNRTHRLATLIVQRRGKRAAFLELRKGDSKQVGKYTVAFNDFIVHRRKEAAGGDTSVGASLSVDYPGAKATAVLYVSVKRLISLIWIGSALMLIGGTIAIIRRCNENRKLVPSAALQERAAGPDRLPRRNKKGARRKRLNG